MKTPARQSDRPRFLVTLDTSEAGHQALDTAVRLAALLNAELEGVFIEDSNLLRIAELPFLREVRPSSLVEEGLSLQRLQRELRTLAKQAERMLEQAARTSGIHWTFRTWRGRTAAGDIADTFSADFVGMGCGSTPAIAASWSRTRLQTRTVAETRTPILVLYNDTEQARRALVTACRLAQDIPARLCILLTDAQDPDRQQRDIARTLDTYGLQADYIPYTSNGPKSLLPVTLHNRHCLLFAGADNALLRDPVFQQALDTAACMLVIAR